MWRFERREQKLAARKKIMRKHGRNMAQQYKQAVFKRRGGRK